MRRHPGRAARVRRRAESGWFRVEKGGSSNESVSGFQARSRSFVVKKRYLGVPFLAPRPGLEPGTCGLTGLPPRRNAPFGVGERDSTPLHAKGGLEEFGRLVGDTAQSAGAMQVNHRGVAADAGFCRSAPGALRVSFASKSIHAVLAPRAYGT